MAASFWNVDPLLAGLSGTVAAAVPGVAVERAWGFALVALLGLILGVVAVLQSMRRRNPKDLSAALATFIDHDPLTGLANRSVFLHRLGRAKAGRDREAGRAAAVMLVNLDGFDSLHRALGRAAGDAILREMAGRLRKVSGRDTLAALGDHEFGILLDDVDDGELRGVVERVRGAFDEPVVLPERTVVARASIGVALVESGADAATVLRHADIALCEARSAGSGRCEFFLPMLYETVVARHELEADLALALKRRELVLHYQPVVDLATSGIVAVEALVRWQHPNKGLLPPARFIRAAEETGLIADLGAWVLGEAIRQVAVWNETHGRREALGVGVNVSPCELRLLDFVEGVAAVVSKTGVDPGLVTLEITESALMTDTEATIARLERLKAIGVRLAMDDFGTGYASLSYLRRLPFDVLKIDRSFVAGIANEEEEWAVATAIVRLATSLGKGTLAEGVETHAQRAHLRALGCELAQGYLFGHPVPANQLEGLLTGDRRLRGEERPPADASPQEIDVRRRPSPPGMSRMTAQPPAPLSGSEEAGIPPILVAEDDAVSRDLLLRFFRKMRMANPLVMTGDGDEAIAYLDRAAAGMASRPVLMVLDHVMPSRSGLDVLRWCRHLGWDEIPAVILTGSSQRDDIDEAYVLGAASYLVKPLGLRALEDVLRSLPVPWAFMSTEVNETSFQMTDDPPRRGAGIASEGRKQGGGHR